ncbi:4-hydroxy-tetrahydrodipicolinate synthase [Mechercharimyces sp. CAU 1602]|uniref:4-hydroxy-tetrahydrodipicolinate synthase n=1 Tax=Mechercharimyces sp. CAU 1602 TaxID=2973933 RepID=UPI0021629788|nr:4-hydroxy-tetrahydrodipicolinate synthase [Mechercharimyces sp. CAU 1602]MCS1351256.1 4-hydroxy-tetrahydrodipicolinate synthase [Mechercharimyces sp. CAU 1602]
MKFGRLMTAMVTPMNADGAIDWNSVGSMMDHLIATGTETIVLAGTTGESSTLTEAEKLELFRFAVKHTQNRVQLIAGTGSNNTAASVRFTQVAADTGVDGIMAVTPYYNKPSQEGLYQHFRAIAEITALPLMIYNVPPRTGVNMSAVTMARIAALEQVVAVKEASGDLVQTTELASMLPEEVALYSGVDELLLPYLAVGADGVVSVVSHLVGKEMKEMMDTYFAGDVKRARQLHQELLPLVQATFMTSSPAPLKYALSLKGVCAPHLRLPIVELTEDEAFEMKRAMKSLQLL